MPTCRAISALACHEIRYASRHGALILNTGSQRRTIDDLPGVRPESGVTSQSDADFRAAGHRDYIESNVP